MCPSATLSEQNRGNAKTPFYLVAIAVFCFCGCSPDANSVTGQVKLNGEPLPGALVTFVPKNKGARIALSKTDDNGSYRLKSSRNITDVTPGNYKVEITTSRLSSNGGRESKSPELLPPKFNKRTELLKQIQPGSNQIDFNLQTE